MAGELGVEQVADTAGGTTGQAPATQATSVPPPDPAAATGAPTAEAPAAASTRTPEQIAQDSLRDSPATPAPPAAPAPPQLPPEVQARLDRLDQYERQLPQLQQYAQLGYRAWQERQQAESQRLRQEQEQQAARPWFGLPDFDLALAEFVERDPATGQLRAREGAAPDTLAKYQQFHKALAETQLGFFKDPAKYLAEPVKRIAAEVAQGLIRQHFGGYEQKVQADRIIAENRDWMVAAGPGGQPQLTPAGQLYQQFGEDGARLGITDPAQLHQYAVERVQLRLLLAERQQRQAGAQGDAAKEQFLRAAQPTGRPANPVPPPPAAPVPGGPQSLRDMLLADFRANGITDANFKAV